MKNLQQALAERGIQIGEWYAENGLRSSGVSHFRTGKSKLPAHYVHAICKALGVGHEEALEIARQPPSPPRSSDTPFARLLNRHGLKRMDVAAASGLSKGSLNDYCQGVFRRPHAKAMRALAFAIGCTLNDLEDCFPADSREAKVLPFADKPRPVADPALLREFKALAERCGRRTITIPNERSYDHARDLVQEVQVEAEFLTEDQQTFLGRMVNAIKAYQRVHGLDRVREAA